MMRLLKNVRERAQAEPAECGRLMFRAAPDVKASVHAQGMILIHHRKGVVFSSNKVGAMIWKGATERRSLDELALSISAEFDIPGHTVRHDALAFLAALEAEGLLVPDAG